MKTLKAALPLLPLFAAAALVSSCGERVSVFASSSDPRTNEKLDRVQKTGSTVYNGWKALDAINDSVDKISHQDELDVGQLAALSVIAQVGDLVLDDENLVRYVNSVGNLVALQGERKVSKPRTKGRRFFFGILESSEVNAFSTPGGNVLITSGLLERLNSEAELAFVLGHEIAHIDYEHGLAALKAAFRTDEGAKSLIELTLRKDKNKEPITNLFDDVRVFDRAGFLAADVAIGSKLNFRDDNQERASDALGLEYMVKAGYDPQAAVRVVEMLADAGDNKKSATHGKPEVRLKEIEKQIKKLPSGTTGKTGFFRWQNEGLARLEAAVAPAAQKPDNP